MAQNLRLRPPPWVDATRMGLAMQNQFIRLAVAALLASACAPAPELSLATPQVTNLAERGALYLADRRDLFALSPEDDFTARSATPDALGRTHIRYDQTYRGVRVFGGEAIVEFAADGTPQRNISGLHSDIRLSTVPAFDAARALSQAEADLRPQGPYAHPPTTELVVYPQATERERPTRLRGRGGELNALDLERVVTSYSLAYHVHTELENGATETAHTDYLIDAHSGDILQKWSTLYTASAMGHSQYSGDVSLNTVSTPSGDFGLTDTVRGMHFSTYNMDHGTTGFGQIYTDSNNTWGDGRNYQRLKYNNEIVDGPTTNDNGQTAAIDAHYATGQTYDLYFNVFGRNGIDGLGTPTQSRVHYSTRYDNAFWADTCFCMTYGDGAFFTVLTALDVAGHEMTHGVISTTARLVYSGESGGINEALSDIMGTMAEYYSRGGQGGGIIPDSGGNFLIGEQLSGTPLRFMYKPSLDGASKDAWSSALGGIDVHFASGPMNRAFYFLSQGASSTSGNVAYSSYLPGGMAGIGNDKAARIAYLALTAKMKQTEKYADARNDFLSAATDLYGAGGPEYIAVENAFAAVNVGSAHVPDTTPPTTSLSSPAAGTALSGTVSLTANASDDIGVTKVEFYANGALLGSDTSAPYSLSVELPRGSCTLTSRAYDAAGNIGTSAPISVTSAGDVNLPWTTITSPAAGTALSGTVSFTASASDSVGVTKVEFYVNGMLLGTAASAPYSLSLDTTVLPRGGCTLTSRAYDAAGNIGTSAPVSVTIRGDVNPPTTTITSPATQNRITGVVKFTADASDDVGVTRVEFYIDGSLLGSVASAPYSLSVDTDMMWYCTDCELISKAYDAEGNVGTSTPRLVTFYPPLLPYDWRAFVSSPAESAILSGVVTITADISPKLSLTRVDFYVDGLMIGSGNTAPYSLAWDTSSVSNDLHVLAIKSYDKAGKVVVTSDPSVTVSVNNDRLDNGDFEVGSLDGWTTSGTVAVQKPYQHSGKWCARVGGSTAPSGVNTLSQTLTVPTSASTLTFWAFFSAGFPLPGDYQRVQILSPSGAVLATPVPQQRVHSATWTQFAVDLSAYAGTSVVVSFQTKTLQTLLNSGQETFMRIDDVRWVP